MVYGIQRLGTRPQSAIAPGEYRPMGMGNKGNTYIQINNYGNQCYRGWDCDAWANPCHNCEDEGNSKFGNILGWVGVGLEAVGSIVGLFTGNSKSSSSQVTAPEAAPSSSSNITTASAEPSSSSNITTASAEPSSSSNITTASAEPSSSSSISTPSAEPSSSSSISTPSAEPSASNAVAASDGWPAEGSSAEGVTVKDKSGRTQDIKGKMTVSKAGASAGDPPKNFSIQTAAGFKYEFELVPNNNGKIIYKCVSETDSNGNTRASSGQEYECKTDSSGKVVQPFEFIQDAGAAGYGSAV